MCACVFSPFLHDAYCSGSWLSSDSYECSEAQVQLHIPAEAARRTTYSANSRSRIARTTHRATVVAMGKTDACTKVARGHWDVAAAAGVHRTENDRAGKTGEGKGCEVDIDSVCSQRASVLGVANTVAISIHDTGTRSYRNNVSQGKQSTSVICGSQQ